MGVLAVHQRAVLVGRARDFQLAVAVDDEPGPAAAEAGGRRLGKLFLERFKAAERLQDGFGQGALRRAAGVGAHDAPEQRVVGVAAAVVAHRGLDVGRNVLEVAEQLFDRLVLQLGILLERRVQAVDVRRWCLPWWISIVCASMYGSSAS